MSRPAKVRVALDDSRRALAESCVPMAFRLAGAMARKRPAWVAEELRSAALLALVEAACQFNPSRGVKFSTFAHSWIRWKLTGRKRPSRSAEVTGLLDGDLVPVADRSPAPGAALESAEAFDAMCRKLPRKHAEAIRLIYHDGLSHESAAERIGVCPSRVSQLHLQSMAMLREELGQ